MRAHVPPGQPRRPRWMAWLGIGALAIAAIGVVRILDGATGTETVVEIVATEQTPTASEGGYLVVTTGDPVRAVDDVDHQRASYAPASTDETSSGVDGFGAWHACAAELDATFPLGARIHAVTGTVADGVLDDRWFWQVEVVVTDLDGVTRVAEMRCTVGGTSGAPAVEALSIG